MNLDKLKEMAIMLAYAVPITPHEKFPFLCLHPFTNSTVVCFKDMTFCDLKDELQNKRWFTELKETILYINDFSVLWMMIGDNWKLTYLKYAIDYFEDSEFAEYLADAWVLAENPNNDVNCSLDLLIKWFRRAEKKSLMTEKDYHTWTNIPHSMKIYRGVGVNRNEKGLSWTNDVDTAIWFANRFNHGEERGILLEAVVDKENVLAYFNTRGEKEVLVDYKKIKSIKELDL